MQRNQLSSYRFTKSGFEKLTTEQLRLTKERAAAVEDLAKARAMGDLSENGYYKAARARLSSIDSRIRHLAILLKYGRVVEPQSTLQVEFGVVVTVSDGRKEREFTIVGPQEADPLQGKLSVASPIGKAVTGKKVGDSVSVEVPAGKVTFTILKIDLPHHD